MASLTDIVRSRRSQGASVTGALAGGVKERLKEKFDPRQLINQRGLLTALFPGLKAYQAKTSASSSRNEKSINKSSAITTEIKPLFENIQFNTTITAKNLSVLPSLHRDFNVIRQNIVKLLKLEKMDARTKADMYFIAAQKREAMYEAQLMSIRGKSISPSRTGILDSNTELLKKLLIAIASISVITLAFKGVKKAIDTITDIDLKKVQEDFVDDIQNAVDDLFFNIASKIKWSEIEKLLSFNSNLEEELSKKSFASLTKEQKEKFLDAQIKAQSVSIKNFESKDNPAKLIFEEWQKKFGGKPGYATVDPITKKLVPYAEFPSTEAGKKAQRAWWEDPNQANMPLNEALRKFVNPKNEESYQQYLEIMSGSLESSSDSKTPTNTTTKPEITGSFDLPFKTDGSKSRKILSPRGLRKSPVSGKLNVHEGLDYKMDEGTDVLAAEGGTVIQASMMGGYGQTITLQHGPELFSRYSHLKEMKVKVGDVVKKGEVIAASGGGGVIKKDPKTGENKFYPNWYSGSSTGPHLHFEIRKSLDTRTKRKLRPDMFYGEDVEPSANPRDFGIPTSSIKGDMINSASFELAHADLNNNIPPILITVNKYVRRNKINIGQDSYEGDYLPQLFQTVIL